ncbi:hypothetical protein FHG64_15825 [Antarcticibacterium flavum]|uniref:Uncharacterized protein n=1 Tax=Antarcticibacterium flavum TaxID=2058175 RepID=A0A5B7X7J4_9FLAO|nr:MULTISPECIES: hypothetical protein [Antarcticibacterium]MCM4161897.1 hypothetical protein [Antarcticibacterium sp. W02-3]QCY70742.1 hypothetical protein FHG64_15825 [Antarcticibacterium flavum]
MQKIPADHTFYKRSRKKQNKILLLIGLGALGFNLLMLLISIFTGWYLLVLFTFAISLSIIAPFFDTPQMVKNGKLTYFSSLFLAETERKAAIVIHGGTLFDYFFVIDRDLNGQQRTNLILQKFIEGLLHLTSSYHSKDAGIRVKGTSYILNERTLEKAGFTIVKTDVLQYVILIWNYFNLTLSLSLAKAKLTFPNLGRVVTFEAELSSLMDRRSYLESLNTRLTTVR